MPTLQQLKDKWFLSLDGTQLNGLPNRRHTTDAGENTLAVSTDGNTVIPLLDGKAYMKRWHDKVVGLLSAPDAELFHAGWRFDAVKPEGETISTHDAIDDVIACDASGSVGTFVLICRNAMSFVFNWPTIDRLRFNGVFASCLDNRFPPSGTNHQKFAMFKSSTSPSAVLGSIDISRSRWDTPAHLPKDPDRNPSYGKQTHDTGVAIEGPAVADIEKTYRERWNDPTRTLGLLPLLPPQPLITTPIAAPPASGTHSVQTLRTYGITSEFFGYSWSPRGEFTVWASYINAIKKATTYIYIEDQYFLPFDWPPCHTRVGTVARDTDIVYQLGEAMKRGVRVAVVTPSNAEDSTHVYQKYQRDIGVNYLSGVKLAGAPGDVVVASLTSGGSDVYVHSKLMLVDDEFLLIGSTNVGQRSMTCDGELHVGVVDADNLLAKDFRRQLWSEHTGRPPATFDDPVTDYATFKSDTWASVGHLKLYPADPLAVYPTPAGASPPVGHGRVMRMVVDPYVGPPGLR
jgi:phosphatidylserine/phosphatidylglycerophosphate/cardiolipin synthase-like enzyme